MISNWRAGMERKGAQFISLAVQELLEQKAAFEAVIDIFLVRLLLFPLCDCPGQAGGMKV